MGACVDNQLMNSSLALVGWLNVLLSLRPAPLGATNRYASGMTHSPATVARKIFKISGHASDGCSAAAYCLHW